MKTFAAEARETGTNEVVEEEWCLDGTRFWAGSHEFRVIKQDEIFSLSIPKLPADYISDH